MISFDRWCEFVAGHVAKKRERATGHVTLTFFTDAEEDLLQSLRKDGLKPKQAADKLLAARAAS